MSAAELPSGCPCSIEGCVLEGRKRKGGYFCDDHAPKRGRPKASKDRRCKVRGCERTAALDGMCPLCHPNGGPEAVALAAVADGKSVTAALAKHGYELTDAGLAALMSMDAPTRIAALMQRAKFDPSKTFQVLGELLEATKPLVTRLGEPIRDTEGNQVHVPDMPTRMEATKLSLEVLGLAGKNVPVQPSGPAFAVQIQGNATLVTGEAPPSRGVVLPPLKPRSPDDRVIVVQPKDEEE